MDGYHGWSLGKDAFIANTEQQAIDEFSKRAGGRRIAKSVYPVFGMTEFYVSENGLVFGLIYDKHKDFYVGYGPKEREKFTNHKHQDYGVWVGFDRGEKGATIVRVERLIWAAFVLLKWDDNLKVDFKDGDEYHVDLDNLMESTFEVPEAWTNKMEMWKNDYKKYFNYVVDFVEFKVGVCKEAAQDTVQDCFFWLVRHPGIPDKFVNCWIHWSVIQAGHEHRRLHDLREYEDGSAAGATRDKPFEIDLLGVIKNNKHREMLRLYMCGYEGDEIAKMFGTTEGTIRMNLRRMKKTLRAYFAKDIAVMNK